MATQYKTLAVKSNYIKLKNQTSDIMVIREITVEDWMQPGYELIVEVDRTNLGGGIYFENKTSTSGGNLSLPGYGSWSVDTTGNGSGTTALFNIEEVLANGTAFIMGCKGSTSAPIGAEFVSAGTMMLRFVYTGAKWELVGRSVNYGY